MTILCAFLGLQIAFGGQFSRTAQLTDVPVYTDDSPEAWETFAHARDQVQKDNLAEAVRLYQVLLDDFSSRLMSRSRTVNDHPADDNASDEIAGSMRRFVSVRSRVHQAILANTEILRLYRETNEPTAQRLFDDGQYESVFISRLLTPTGIRAAIALAENEIRLAHFHSALRILDETRRHPDFDKPEFRLQQAKLIALAGLLSNEANAYREALDVLQQTPDGREIIERLRRITDTQAGDDQRLASIVQPFDVLVDPSLAEVKPSPVWRFDFSSGPDEALRYKSLSTNQREGIRTDRQMGLFANVAPTAVDDLILASDGIIIYALDRFDGRERWRYPESTPLHSLEKAQLREGGTDGGTGELSIVATNGIVAVGRIYKPDESQLGRRTINQIVCMDVESGQVLWSIEPDQIDPTFLNASFHGSPTLSSGRVFVTVRTFRQRLASEYLVCLDAQSGAVEWSRYLVSSATVRSWPTAGPKLPLVDRGVVYVASPFGCYAAIDSATGIPLWVELESPDAILTDYTTRTLRPWESDRPIMTELGLLSISPNYDHLVLLNPQTGARLARISVDHPEQVRYLVTNGDAVYGVGAEVMRLDRDRLRTAINQVGTMNDETDLTINDPWIPVFTPHSGEQLFGRVSAGRDRMVVPTDHMLYLIDSNDGSLVERASHAEPGTPLVIHGEVIVATNEGIDSYMPYSLAEPRLRARMNADPDNPGPAISLARLAGRHHQFDHILPAIDDAMRSISLDPLGERNRRMQKQLFDTILDLVNDPALADAEGEGRRSSPSQDLAVDSRNSIAEDLFVRLDLIASTVDQRLDYLFSLAAFQAREGRPGSAVDAFQEILSTPSLADAMLTVNDRHLRARYEATLRLRELVSTYGPAIYAIHRQAASDELARANPDDHHRTSNLLRIARQFPMAPAAPEACLQAGQDLIRKDHPFAAIEAWRHGLSLQPAPDIEGRLLSNLVHTLEDQGRIDDVFRELRAAEQQNRSLQLVDPDGQTTSIQAWRTAFIERLRPGRRMARLGDFDDSPVKVEKGDEILLPIAGRPSSSVALVRYQRELRAFGGPGAELLWEQPLDRAEVGLLRIDDDEALLWGAERQFPRYAQKIALSDGRTIWQTNIWNPSDDNFEGDADAGSARNLGRSRRRIGRIEPVVGENEIIFAIMSGDVVCVDSETGRVRWTRRALLPEITHVASDPFGIVVAGHRRLDEAQPTPTLIVLDPTSGKQIESFEADGPTTVQWMVSDGGGRLVVSMTDVTVCYDLFEMEKRWQLDGLDLPSDSIPAVAGRFVFVPDADEVLQMIETTTGRTTSEPSISLGELSTSPARVYSWRGQSLYKSTNGVYVFEHDGSRTGELARSGSANLNISSIAPATDRAVIVEAREEDRSRTRKQLVMYQIDRTGRRITGEIYPDASLPKIDMAQAIDDWVLIDVGSHVLFFHAPAATGNH